MFEISCFYIDCNQLPINFTFIKYKKFIKIFLNKKSIIIEIENLKKSQILLKIYNLSLVCTENLNEISSIINDGIDIYGISTQIFERNLGFSGTYDFIILEKNFFKNPLLGQEPIRETSIKKQKKFFRAMHYHFFNN